MRLPFPFISVKKKFWGFRFCYVSINCSMLPCKPLGYTSTNVLCVHGPHQMCICKRAVKLLLHLPNSKDTTFGIIAASLQRPFLLFPFLLFIFYLFLFYFLILYFLLYFIFNLFFTCVPSFRSIYTCKTQYQYKYDRISWH